MNEYPTGVVVRGADLHVETLMGKEFIEGLRLTYDGKHVYVSGAQSGIDVARYTLEELNK